MQEGCSSAGTAAQHEMTRGWRGTGHSAPAPEAGFVRARRLSAPGREYPGLQTGELFLLKENCKYCNLNKDRKWQFNNRNRSSLLPKCHVSSLT